MKEVLACLFGLKGEQARIRVLESIVSNRLTKENCRIAAKDLLEEEKIYRTRSVEQQKKLRTKK